MTSTGPEPSDWWTRLYDATHTDTYQLPPTPGPDPEEEAADRTPWWSKRPHPAPEQSPDALPLFPDPSTLPPGFQITIQAPAPQPATRTVDPAREARIRRLAYNASAAGVGWYLGLGPLLLTATRSAGDVALGAGFVLVMAIPDWYLRHLRRREGLGTLIAWTARIPLATAVLALALYTPGAVL